MHAEKNPEYGSHDESDEVKHLALPVSMRGVLIVLDDNPVFELLTFVCQVPGIEWETIGKYPAL